jgi:hypothetical protein
MAKTKKRMNKTNKNGMNKKMKKKGTKRKMTPWNAFVKKVYAREKKNGKSFRECLVIAAKEKKQGKMN